MSKRRPVVLCILDGWGLSEDVTGNAVAQAETPIFDRLMSTHPNSTLITYGVDVGLPDGQMGNSEVGHMNIGAGRIVEMDLQRIAATIQRGVFANLPGIKRFSNALKNSGGTAHLIGIVSDGGVHSHIDHMIETARALCVEGVPVAIHAITDGRDVAPKSAIGYLEDLQDRLPDGARLATVIGRYFAMDRDNRWDRVERAYSSIARGAGVKSDDPFVRLKKSYENDITDEFVTPTVIGDYAGFQDGDGVMCLNFRADRARQLMAAFGDPDFDMFEVKDRANLTALSGFTEYSESHSKYMDCVFPRDNLQNTMGSWIAQKGLRQFHIAETEKYPHVTFFLNGGRENPEDGEDRYMAASPRVATYDMQPEMSANEVTQNLVTAIKGDTYDMLVVNYANPDMVGHTGNLDAAKEACSAVDTGLGRVVDAVTEVGGAMIVTGDHGNCEMMIDPETGGPHTAHTTNPVPVVLIGGPKAATLRDNGILADLAPSVLALMGLDQPDQMTGQSLIIE